MASYATDPRTGLLVVTQDDGTQLPGMMPEMAPQFDAMGMTRAVDGPSHTSAPTDGGGGGAFDMGAPPTADQVPTDGAPQLSHAFEGFAPPPPGAGPAMTPGQAAVAGAMGDNISHTGGSRPRFDPNEFNRDPADSFQGAPPRNKLAGPSAPVDERAKSGTTKLSIGEDGSVAPVGGGRGGGARFVDVPLSKLRVTGRQVEHDRYDALSPEERMARQIPLAEQEQRLGFAERRDKLNRDQVLLNEEKKYYDQKNLLQAEERKQAEINKRTRLLEYERNELDKEAKNASVDPKRYFNDMSIWTKMVAAIGATLQGAAMGLSGQGGGMPPIIGLMQDLNKQDIEGQKLKMESAVARGKLANDRYEKAVALWGDPDLAEMQMERDKLALTDGWLARQASAQQADAQASEAIAGMRQQITERRIALDDELSLRGKAKVTDQLQATPQRMVGGGGSGGGATNKLRQRIVRMPDGTLKFAQDEKGAEAARKFMTASANAQRLAREIIQLRKESGSWERLTGTGKGAQLEAKVNQLRLVEKERNDLGQLTGSDTALMSVPDAGDLFESGAEDMLNTVISEVGVQAQDYSAQYLSDDPAGTIMPEGAITGGR